jgi:dihydrofolate reductase
MRKIIYAINISLDGCVDHTSFGGSADEELFDYFTGNMRGIDLSVYGRKMYELMFPYWANVAKDRSGTKWENEFAQTITGVDKVVFSRTLDSIEGNTVIVRTDPVAELLKLKQAPGKNISVDTVSMFAQLAQAGLIDEYHLVVHPVIIGRGTRLVKGNFAERLQLKLAATKVFKSGCVAFKYVKS